MDTLLPALAALLSVALSAPAFDAGERSSPAGTASAALASPDEQPAGPQSLVPRLWLVLAAVDARGRRPFARDAVFARHLLDAAAPPPVEGETLVGELGAERAWSALEAGDDGSLDDRGISWAYARLEVAQGGVWMADVQAAHTLFVNGAGFAGDYYGQGQRGVPVELRAGANDIYLTGLRGRPRLSFWRPPAELFVAEWDKTVPDLVRGRSATAQFGALVVNASAGTVPGGDWSVWVRRVEGAGATIDGSSFPWPLAPLSIVNPGVSVLVPRGERALELDLWAGRGQDTSLSAFAVQLELPRVAPGELRVETFRSRIDDSVQKYALLPASEPQDTGLVLSLHGAGVDCRNQAASYSAQPDLAIVAPTNRRPFGFDWQDWGRADAYEVLEHALELTGASRERIYLTGHSMGGHGVWHLAANDPGTWAAIAPSAGWASFDSYGGRPADELSELWQDADATSRTLALIDNLVQLPTFVLHGEADDNVPASEGRAMLAALESAGASPASHFQPGAGHWWDGDAAPGADCLTWPAIFELFATSRRPVDPVALDFTSVDPAVQAQHHWLRVEQQLAYGAPTRVRARFEPEAASLRVRTENARRIALEPPAEWTLAGVIVDGFHFEARGGERLELMRIAGAWTLAAPIDPQEKHPARGGPFKRAFDRAFVLVHGTAGSAAENAELLARARFDAGTWRYRANGHAWILSDADFIALSRQGVAERCNVILYGNRDTNSAWSHVLDERCPVVARRGAIQVGDAEWRGDDLACLFVFPRAGTAEQLVGVFADSGPAGTRLGYRAQTFVSGAGFPDLALVGADVLTRGDAAVRCAGFFDATWNWRRGRVQRGHFQADHAPQNK